MKKMKRLSAILLSLVIISAMCVTALATEAAVDYSITITNAKLGETYKAYKMLNLSVDDITNPKAYRYTLNTATDSDWTEFAKNVEFTNVFTIDEQGYISSTSTSEKDWVHDGKVSILAEKAGAFAEDNTMTPAKSVTIKESDKITAADGTVSYSGKIELTEAGYYVITSTMGTRAMIVTTPDQIAVEIKEKNKEDTVEKRVREDSTSSFDSDKNDAQIGDDVVFRTMVSVAPRSVNIKLHDTMDSGFTFDPKSVEVYSTFTALDHPDNVKYTGKYTLRYDAVATDVDQRPDSGDTFTIDFDDELASTLTTELNYYVIYKAKLNKNAVQKDGDTGAVKGVDQINRTTVSYGNSQKSKENITTTTTHNAEVFKFYSDKTDPENIKKVGLAGSVFELYKGDGTNDILIKLVKLDDNNYRVADSTETGTAETHVGANEILNTVAANALVKDFVSVGEENVTIWGLDSDNDYKIREIRTPEGYNKLTADTPVKFDTSTAGFMLTEVENRTGAELPSTGGIGAKIFFISGGVLVLGAAVIFVVRRKMKKDEAA